MRTVLREGAGFRVRIGPGPGAQRKVVRMLAETEAAE